MTKYREGSLEAPTRHAIDWENPSYSDPEKLDEELRRVFDVCHGCRRCFNLCDTFPRLFDLVDNSPSGELDTVSSQDFKPLVDACTLCDMCFSNKCPYVPPHEFNIDFPHLMLQYRFQEHQQGKNSKIAHELAKIDRNAALSKPLAPLVNWATDEKNMLSRAVIEKTVGIHRQAAIPKFQKETWVQQAQKNTYTVNTQAPAYGQKAVLFATCFCNYNDANLGNTTQALLAYHGVETHVVYPACCGMPMLEQGNIPKVVENAKTISAQLLPWVEKSYTIIAMVPSCALMIKQEWPLLLPNDPIIQQVSQRTQDICQYIVNLHHTFGLYGDLKPLEDKITLHISCHSRAQNMGQKAAELLRLIPNATVQVIERCSGHGGLWGMMVDHFDVALKVGKPVVNQAIQFQNNVVLSECPLAATHIRQGIENHDNTMGQIVETTHPLMVFARACGIS